MNTKAVLTDEQIEAITKEHSMYLKGWEWCGEIIDVSQDRNIDFARAIEAAVLASADNHAVAFNQGDLMRYVREFAEVCYGQRHTTEDVGANLVNYVKSLIAPASADNPSTAGAAKPAGNIGDYSQFHAFLDACYEAVKVLDNATGGEVFDASDKLTDAQNKLVDYINDWSAILAAPVAQSTADAATIDTPEFWAILADHVNNCDGGQGRAVIASRAALVAYIDAHLAAPALNPSEVRDQALEEAMKTVEFLPCSRDDHPHLLRAITAIHALRTASKDQRSAQPAPPYVTTSQFPYDPNSSIGEGF